ncbi:MAG: N-acetylneuraminate synthase family protein, partial [Bacteroidia bacterium]
ELFPDCIIGLSDHTMGIGASIASIALGARVIEKHFTLNRADGGVDSTFSMEPEEMQSLVVESERAFLALGMVQLSIQKAEEKSKMFKRSIYIVKDISAGEVFSKENIRIIRPGDGLEPKHFETIIGKTCTQDVKRGTPLSWAYLN